MVKDWGSGIDTIKNVMCISYRELLEGGCHLSCTYEHAKCISKDSLLKCYTTHQFSRRQILFHLNLNRDYFLQNMAQNRNVNIHRQPPNFTFGTPIHPCLQIYYHHSISANQMRGRPYWMSDLVKKGLMCICICSLKFLWSFMSIWIVVDYDKCWIWIILGLKSPATVIL